MNFVNPGTSLLLPKERIKVLIDICEGLEHPWRVSIDGHKLWIVANDGGFVEPQEVDVLLQYRRGSQGLTLDTDSHRNKCRARDRHGSTFAAGK